MRPRTKIALYCDQIIFINNNPPSTAMNKEYLTHIMHVNTKIIDNDDIPANFFLSQTREVFVSS